MSFPNDTKHPSPIDNSTHAAESSQTQVQDDAPSNGEPLPPDYDAVIAGDVEAQVEDTPNLTSSIHELDFVGEVWYGGLYHSRWKKAGSAAQVVSVRVVKLPQHAASEIKSNEWLVSVRFLLCSVSLRSR